MECNGRRLEDRELCSRSSKPHSVPAPAGQDDQELSHVLHRSALAMLSCRTVPCVRAQTLGIHGGEGCRSTGSR